MFVVIAASVLLYFWQSRRAERRVNQIESLADSTISDMTEKLQDSSASVETQAALFQGAIQYLDQLRKSSRNDPRILLQLSKAYRRLGNLEGSPFVANLGDRAIAAANFQEALQTALAAQARLPGTESKFHAFLRDEKEQAPRSCWNKFSNVMSFLKANGISRLVGKND